MVENEIKRHDIFLIVFGIILGFADPITDILTLVEFYREDHKTWFGVGLTFVFLPCFVFLRTYYVLNKSELKKVSIARRCTQVILCAANPFFPAFLKLQTLFSYLKNFTNFWRGNNVSGIDSGNSDEEAHVDLLHQSNVAVLFEGTLEAAPQFIIQLYAMVVQQESVTIVQMVSLPVSFLSLAWASTVGDEFIHYNAGGTNAERNLIHRLTASLYNACIPFEQSTVCHRVVRRTLQVVDYQSFDSPFYGDSGL